MFQDIVNFHSTQAHVLFAGHSWGTAFPRREQALGILSPLRLGGDLPCSLAGHLAMCRLAHSCSTGISPWFNSSPATWTLLGD